MPHKALRYAVYAALTGLLLAAIFFLDRAPAQNAPESIAQSAACKEIEFPVSLIAKAAYAKDLTSGTVLFEKNAEAQLPLASLTKLATAYTAFDILSPNDAISITPEDLSPEGDAGLRVGEVWKAQDLLDYTLMVSANDGIHAIAEAAAAKKNEPFSAFIAGMNEKARSLGLNETYFSDDTGLDISSTTAGAFGSARDVAALLSNIVQTEPRLVEGTHYEKATFTSESGIVHHAENTSSVLEVVGGGIASKTGYTDLAGGNLAILFEPLPGRPVVAVILGSTREGRDTDMENLAVNIKRALKRVILCQDGSQSP
ncbi:MAG: D-alanyl-D-alanine carboxypeptidase [Patescibacteria group bacterium]|nr:D-alanyl-D-alanine carboxypeptidase [Patescibacteria group bacterium]